jgi:hypothetical protein
MKVAKRIVLKIELSLILFILFLVLFIWPFFSSPILSNLKVLFAYLFIVWGIAICILFLISRRLILYHRNQSSHDQR